MKNSEGFDSEGLDGLPYGYAEHASTAEAQEPPIPLRELVRNLVDEANATVQAEVNLLKARGDLAKQGVITTSIWAVIAAATAFVALLAFAFGVILALATLVGPLAATAIVVAVLAIIAIIAALRAKSGVSAIQVAFRRQLSGEGDKQ